MHAANSAPAVVATFIDGFQAIQRFSGPIESAELNGIRYLVFANGRRSTRYTHEFFPLEVDAETAIATAREVDPDGDHQISLLSQFGESRIATFQRAGYEHWGNEMLMVRDLTTHRPESSTIEVRPISGIEEGSRIYQAQEDASLPGHPVTLAHLEASDVLQRWVSSNGEPAAFGRIVLLRDSAYLSDVVTLPAFRRRGYAEALVKQLLLDALENGARNCVLTSSEMGYRVYKTLGFVDVVPLTGFQTAHQENE